MLSVDCYELIRRKLWQQQIVSDQRVEIAGELLAFGVLLSPDGHVLNDAATADLTFPLQQMPRMRDDDRPGLTARSWAMILSTT